MSVGHYENFPVASRLVPTHLRGAVVAIYHFARSADDLADEGDAAPAERLRALDAYARSLDAIERGETPSEPPFPALAQAVRDHQLSLRPLRDLLSAFRQDVVADRYATIGDLLDYCRRSANPVGHLMLALYDAESADNLAASDSVCTGLQLANMWQDVAQDFRRGRVYLPQEDLARFGVDERAIADGRCGERWGALMRFETDRTRPMLARGRPLARALPVRLGLELSAVIAGGLRILERIDAVRGDVFRHRPTLGAADWALVAGRALLHRTAPWPAR
jgi:squalene synthase HpnC